jgi:hypothetical protein
MRGGRLVGCPAPPKSCDGGDDDDDDENSASSLASPFAETAAY